LTRQREPFDMIQDIYANVAIIKAQARAPTIAMNAKMTGSTLSWAQIPPRDALPPSIQSQNTSGSTKASIDNAKRKEVIIRYARWLKKYKENQRDGSLIVDCETPEGANAIIKAGTLAWHHGLRVTKKCDPACQFLRCLKCYRYGKCKGTYCTNSEICGKCTSKEHNTEECTSKEKK